MRGGRERPIGREGDREREERERERELTSSILP